MVLSRAAGGGLDGESKGTAPESKAASRAGLLSSTEGVDIRVVDVAPLFHTGLVAPTLEAAMMVVEECCKNDGGRPGAWAGLHIVGCYSANRLATSTGVTAVVSRVGQAIRKKLVAKWGAGAGRGGAAPVLVVDNGTFGTAKAGAGAANMYAWSERDGSWGKTGGKRWSVDDGGEAWAETHRGREQNIVDFDDHLDDVTLDFRNQWF